MGILLLSGVPVHSNFVPPNPGAHPAFQETMNLSSQPIKPNYTDHIFPGNRNNILQIENGHISPINYRHSPAPMGISDLGLKLSNGSLLGYNLYPTGFSGTINMSEAETYPSDGNSFSVQLNAVMYQVPISGTYYDIWVQDVAIIDPSSLTMQFVDNIWDINHYTWSSSMFQSGKGSIQQNSIVYVCNGPILSFRFPFSLTLRLNTTSTFQADGVSFAYSLESGNMDSSGIFDNVLFGNRGTDNRSSPTFRISGTTLASPNKAYDAEFVIGGDYGGKNVDFSSLNGTMALDYFSGNYVPVASSYNYGLDTGETCAGVGVTWNSSKAVLQSGPSLLYGMWGASSSNIMENYSVSVAPGNAFAFVGQSYNGSGHNYSWIPLNKFGNADFSLPAGNYSIEALLSGYTEFTGKLSSGTSSIILSRNKTAGIYTPLYANGNSAIANISVSGNGTERDPYLLISLNDRNYSGVNSVFNSQNSFGHAVLNTNVEISDADAYTIISGSPFYTSINNTSNISIIKSSWISMRISNSVNDLVFNNSFTIPRDSSNVLSLWNTTGIYVCGNVFNIISSMVPPPGSAITVNGHGNHIFGNRFIVPFWPAYSLYDYRNGTPMVNFWNVTPSALKQGLYVNGFNVSNSTTIRETGPGNFWFNYNGSGAYNDGYMNSPDYYPSAGIIMNFNIDVEPSEFLTRNIETSLANSTAVYIRNSSGILYYYLFPGRFYNIPTGNYTYGVYANSLPEIDNVIFAMPTLSGAITSNESRVLVNLTFRAVNGYPVYFSENGLEGNNWKVLIRGPGYPGIPIQKFPQTVLVTNGSYNYTVDPPQGYYSSNGSFTVDGNPASITVNFTRYSYFTGSISPPNATMQVDGHEITTPGGHFNVTLKSGTYLVTVTGSGYVTYYKLITVNNGTVLPMNIYLEPEINISIPGIDWQLYILSGLAVVSLAVPLYFGLRKNKHR